MDSDPSDHVGEEEQRKRKIQSCPGKQSSHRRRGEALRRCAPVEELPSQVCVAEAAGLIVRAGTDLSPCATIDLAARAVVDLV